jgi:hypothetical protein
MTTEQNNTENVETTDEQTTDTQVSTPEKSENMIPKSRFDKVIGQKNELNQTLTELADELKQDIPEDMQDLIPSDLSPDKQIKWIRNATKKGLFTKAKESPASETPGKSNPQANLDNMSGPEMLSYYHSNKKY